MKAIIYCSPRTGSSLLGSFFAPHPQIYYIYEDFTMNPAGQTYSSAELAKIHDKFKEKYPSKSMMVKLFYFQTHDINRENSDLLSEFRNWKVIHLIRRNLLDIVASHVLVSSNKHLTPQYGGAWFGVSYNKKAHLDPDDCLNALKSLKGNILKASKCLKKYGIEHRTIFYEDMIQNKEIVYSELQNFLGLPEFPLEPNPLFIRQRRGKLKDNLENYGEIESKLRGTEFEAFLD